MAAGTSRRSFVIAPETYLRGNLAYRDSHAARARVGEGRVGGLATGLLGRRLLIRTRWLMLWVTSKEKSLTGSRAGISATRPVIIPTDARTFISGFQKLQIALAACRISETISAAGTSST